MLSDLFTGHLESPLFQFTHVKHPVYCWVHVSGVLNTDGDHEVLKVHSFRQYISVIGYWDGDICRYWIVL